MFLPEPPTWPYWSSLVLTGLILYFLFHRQQHHSWVATIQSIFWHLKHSPGYYFIVIAYIYLVALGYQVLVLYAYRYLAA